MKIFNLGNFFKFEKTSKLELNKSESNKNSSIKAGDVFSAKIIESKEGMFVLLLESGKMVKAINLSNLNVNFGATVDVEVLESGNVIKGNITEREIAIKTEEEINDRTLKNLGIIPNPDKKEVAKLLKMNSIPITKENLNTVIEEKKYIGKLSELLKNKFIDPIKLDINKSIKSILVDYINNIKDVSENETGDLKLAHMMLSEKNISELLGEKIKVEPSAKLLNDLAANSVNIKADINVENKTNSGNENKIEPLVISKSFEETGDLEKFLTEKLDKVDYKSIVFNLKNNIENTIKNIVLLDKIVLGNDSVYKQLERFSKNIEYIFEKNNITETLNPRIYNLVKEFSNLNFREYDKIDEISQKIINELNNTDISSIAKTVLKSELITIKSSVNYINNLSDKIIFIQMPVMYDDKLKNMDLYVRRNPNREKMDPNNCSVYLSLDTDNLDTVKSYIEIKDGKPIINFRLKEEDIKKIFDKEKEDFSNFLKDKGFRNVIIKNTIIKKDSNFIDDMEEIVGDRIIDVKL